MTARNLEASSPRFLPFLLWTKLEEGLLLYSRENEFSPVDNIDWWLVCPKETESYRSELLLSYRQSKSSEKHSFTELCPFPSDLCSSRSSDHNARIESILA